MESIDLSQQEEEYLNRQSKLFELAEEQLTEQHSGNYVLFEDGQVLDSGKSRAEVAMRAYEREGMRPLFIERVRPLEDPETRRTIWTPFSRR